MILCLFGFCAYFRPESLGIAAGGVYMVVVIMFQPFFYENVLFLWFC